MNRRPFRLAALDIGSLTVRLGIAEIRQPTYPPHLLHRQEAVTRLGARVSATGRLSPQAQAATLRDVSASWRFCLNQPYPYRGCTNWLQ
jgi:exopolyphosphatase/pppGpp-phosphohydrolase